MCAAICDTSTRLRPLVAPELAQDSRAWESTRRSQPSARMAAKKAALVAVAASGTTSFDLAGTIALRGGAGSLPRAYKRAIEDAVER